MCADSWSALVATGGADFGLTWAEKKKSFDLAHALHSRGTSIIRLIGPRESPERRHGRREFPRARRDGAAAAPTEQASGPRHPRRPQVVPKQGRGRRHRRPAGLRPGDAAGRLQFPGPPVGRPAHLGRRGRDARVVHRENSKPALLSELDAHVPGPGGPGPLPEHDSKVAARAGGHGPLGPLARHAGARPGRLPVQAQPGPARFSRLGRASGPLRVWCVLAGRLGPGRGPSAARERPFRRAF